MFHSYVSLPECMFQLVKSDGMENFHQPCWLHWRSEVMLKRPQCLVLVDLAKCDPSDFCKKDPTLESLWIIHQV